MAANSSTNRDARLGLGSRSHDREATPSDRAGLTCFLSASTSTDTEPFRRALAALGVTVQTMDTLPSGTDIGSAVTRTILTADFICVVLAESPPNPTVMFEAGIAVGSQRPLLLVTTPQAGDTIAVDLIKAPVIRYLPESEDAFRGNLSAYLENIQPMAVILTTNYDVLLERTVGPTVHTSALEGARGLEKRIAEYLVGSAAFVTTNARVEDQEIDIIADLPALGAGFNPVLFEVKHHGAERTGAVAQALKQLFGKLAAAGARIGLLVTGDDIESRVEFRRERAVLIVSASELESWDADTLARALSRVRNQLVHSVQ